MVRGRGFSLTDRLPPPLGRRGSLVELQRRALEELDRKRLKTEGEALGFIFFFFDSLKAFVGCHYVSADESGVQPSGCNNIRQAQFTVCIKGAVTLQECFSGGDGTI